MSLTLSSCATGGCKTGPQFLINQEEYEFYQFEEHGCTKLHHHLSSPAKWPTWHETTEQGVVKGVIRLEATGDTCNWVVTAMFKAEVLPLYSHLSFHLSTYKQKIKLKLLLWVCQSHACSEWSEFVAVVAVKKKSFKARMLGLFVKLHL